MIRDKTWREFFQAVVSGRNCFLPKDCRCRSIPTHCNLQNSVRVLMITEAAVMAHELMDVANSQGVRGTAF